MSLNFQNNLFRSCSVCCIETLRAHEAGRHKVARPEPCPECAPPHFPGKSRKESHAAVLKSTTGYSCAAGKPLWYDPCFQKIRIARGFNTPIRAGGCTVTKVIL